MTYYYFVASLPTLALGSPPPMSPAQFRVLRSEHLEPAHLAEVDAVLNGAGDSAFAQRWRRIELQIKNASARVRAQRRGLDGERFVQPTSDFDLSLAARAQEALTAPNPKLRARALDELRWTQLDALAFATPFALPALLAYALKLDLCARWAARTVAAGRARLQSQVDTMLQQFDEQQESA